MGIFGDALSALNDRLQGNIRKIDRILGFVEKGGQVTLEECLYLPDNINLFGQPSKSTILAEMAFIGTNLDEGEVTLTELDFFVEGLDDWLAMSEIDTQVDHIDKSGSIHFRRPEPIRHDLPDSIKIEFNFNPIFPPPFALSPITEAHVSQNAFISLISKEPRDIEYFSSLAFRLCQFLSLALDQVVSIQSITVAAEQDPKDAQTRRISPIRMYRQFRPWTERKPIIKPHNILFTYWDVKDRFEDTMTSWLEGFGAETLGPALNLYFLSTSNIFHYLDIKFLQLMQGIEVLHRKTYNKSTVMPKEDFKSLLESALNSLPENCPDIIRNRFESANQLSLRDRIQEMTESFQCWFGDYEERENFAKTVVDTRNYLTHFNSSVERRAAKEQEMIGLYEKLGDLVRLHLLRLIGFNTEEIDSIVRRSNRLGRRLKVEATDMASTEDQQP